MEIKPIGSDVSEQIKMYDKKLSDKNPSIFITGCEDTKLDENFLFHELYTN